MNAGTVKLVTDGMGWSASVRCLVLRVAQVSRQPWHHAAMGKALVGPDLRPRRDLGSHSVFGVFHAVT